jgi:hypothetical protein
VAQVSSCCGSSCTFNSGDCMEALMLHLQPQDVLLYIVLLDV